MATTPSIKIIKQSAFKGGTRQYANRYHFNGGTPADATHWHTLMDAVVAAEKLIYTSLTTIIEAVGYAAGSEVPVASKSYSTAGTFTQSGTTKITPLQIAGLVRWSTSARSSKNHPVYLFNYFRPAWFNNAAADAEVMASDWKTVLDTYSAAWISGFSDGSITAVRAGPNGATATGHQTEQYLTHRDFPYTPSV